MSSLVPGNALGGHDSMGLASWSHVSWDRNSKTLSFPTEHDFFMQLSFCCFVRAAKALT